MIIYNQDKLPIKYMIKDKLVFDIISDTRLEDILQELRNGKMPTDINISGFYIDELEILKNDEQLLDIGMTTYKERTKDSFIPDYDIVHDDDYEGDVDTGDEFHAEHYKEFICNDWVALPEILKDILPKECFKEEDYER